MIFFFLPEEHFPDAHWREALKKKEVFSLEENGKKATLHYWIYQTWALLTEAAIPCQLVHQIPQEGIVIALSGSLHSLLHTASLFLVDIVADGLPHPSAQLHLLQNKAHAQRLPRSLFIPHWPQPGLIPRDSVRGNRFEKICFFGDSNNLAPELCSEKWKHQLSCELGLLLECRGASFWHDYHDTDCVLAIRDFSRSRQLHKPSTKLYNAWLAGVPFIGGRDSSYAADGHPDKDYLVATSPDQVLDHLRRLKEDHDFRQNLITQGTLSGATFTREATLERWKQLIQETIPQLAKNWFSLSPRKRRYFSLTQHAVCFLDRHLR